MFDWSTYFKAGKLYKVSGVGLNIFSVHDQQVHRPDHVPNGTIFLFLKYHKASVDDYIELLYGDQIVKTYESGFETLKLVDGAEQDDK